MTLVTDTWPARLAPDSMERDDALRELRVILIKGLRTALNGRTGVDDGFIEDTVQTALVRILDHLSSFQHRSAFTTWALSIAMRVGFGELRRKHWGNVSLDALQERTGFLDHELAPQPDPSQSAERQNLFSLVHELIRSQLTPKQRDVLLADLHPVPQDEICAQLGLSRNAIYKLAHDARRALKHALEDCGLDWSQVRETLSNPHV